MTAAAEDKIYKRKIFTSYAVDVACLAVFGVAASVIEFIPPRKIAFDPNDPTIGLEQVTSVWVPNWMLPLFSMALPLLVIVSFMATKGFKQRRLAVAILGLFLSVFLSFLFTNILKNSIGRLRPDLLTNTRINNDNEGRRSFPSGHASSSFGGLAFISLFMAGQLRLLDGAAHLERLLASLLPSILAMLISISRIVDHRHHWDDVLVGSLIGIACAISSYHFYFPSLWSSKCNEPLNTRFIKLKEEAIQEATNSNPEEAQTMSKENVV